MAEGGAIDGAMRWHLAHRGAVADAGLHLAVSVRSFRAEGLSAFVAALLAEDAGAASTLLKDLDQFPVCYTRNLAAARQWLRTQRRAGERAGLLASSNALRLKPEGLHVKAPVDVCHWFLNGNDDVRSSNALEDAATEFDVQGLELDWAGVAWDLNYRRTEMAGSNAYRVLLTRARQGMVIYVPRGDATDATRPPADYDAVAEWLSGCGIPALPSA
jgi:hypothetical protein